MFFILFIFLNVLPITSSRRPWTSPCLRGVSVKYNPDNRSCLILILPTAQLVIGFIWSFNLVCGLRLFSCSPLFLFLFCLQEIRNQSHECSFKVAKYPENRNRNRYRDVSPCRHTDVMFLPIVWFLTPWCSLCVPCPFVPLPCSWSQSSEVGELGEWLHQRKSGLCGGSPEKVHIDSGKYP